MLVGDISIVMPLLYLGSVISHIAGEVLSEISAEDCIADGTETYLHSSDDCLVVAKCRLECEDVPEYSSFILRVKYIK